MMDRENKKSLASVLNKRVTIEEVAGTTDGEGGFTESWSTATANVPASVEPIRAVQQFKNKSVGVDATHFIKTRGDVDIDEEINRIKWGSRVFEILAVEDIQEDGILHFITCKERR
jgi:SPP1 family predicted phage head-tail adaptor